MLDFILYYRYYGIILILIVSFIIAVIINIQLKKILMHKKVVNFLEQFFKDYTNYSIVKNNKKELGYDYHLSFKTMEYYIKLIKNYSNAEISVHSKYQWQSKSSSSDRSIKQIKDVNYLIDKKVEKSQHKKIYKLFIIYPDARRLLLHKEICEIIFIDPQTDIYGVNLITFSELSNDATILDKTVSKRN